MADPQEDSTSPSPAIVVVPAPAVSNSDGPQINENDKLGEDTTTAAPPTEAVAATAPVTAKSKANGLTLAIPAVDEGVHYRKHPRPLSGHLESRSPAVSNTPRTLHRPVSYQPSIGGHSHISSGHSDVDHNIPPPSTDEEKSKMTRRYFATVFALSYSIFLVVFALAVFVGDAVKSQYPLGEAFAIAILVVGFFYFICLYIDIRLHIKKAKAVMKERERRHELFEEQLMKMQQQELAHETGNGNVTSIAIPTLDAEPVKPLSHRYCFQTGRHGELFYLKMGAAWFCFGLLIHSILIISYEIIFLTDGQPHFVECASIISLVLEFLFPIYSIFVLFFVFKYANVIINEGRGFARFFLMHAIGTSLAFWVYTIVRETVDAIRLKSLYKLEKTEDELVYFTETNNFTRMSFISEAIKIECPGPEELNSIYRTFSPYLYPFVIEFCILMVGFYYMMWSNINKCEKKNSAPGHEHELHDHLNGDQTGDQTEIRSISSDHCSVHHNDNHDTKYRSHLILYADCHAASRGLFAGLALVVLTFVVIILFFVAVNEENYRDTGILLDSIFELCVLVLLVLITVAAYYQISKLDVNSHPMSMLDDVLLFIAVPAFFSETIFSMAPAVANGSILNIFRISAQLIQILIQTPFIIDGMRRCSNAAFLRKKKPGRELVTFLTIANVSLWIYYTFSVKTVDTGDERYDFYGDVVWAILNHLSLPLIMFYRFHSSVCLVDIWRHAYEPGGGH